MRADGRWMHARAPRENEKEARRREASDPKSIVIDPRVSFGRPVLAGTGIPTQIIAERYKASESIAEPRITIVRRARSKRPSAASLPPLETLTFFIDRSLGRTHVADALRRAGARVVIHDDYFAPDALDTEWLGRAGAEGWIVLTTGAPEEPLCAAEDLPSAAEAPVR